MDATTTSYAVLGLLALQPWSAYELTRQARRSFHYIHPKSESHLYNEPKRLVAMGWATATTERNGKRSRTVYEITPAGRDALGAWLASPASTPQLEIEALLRTMFCDQTDRATIIATLQQSATDMVASADEGRELVVRSYLTDEGGPFPERRHISALVVAFYAQFAALYDDWCRFAAAEIERWPTTTDLGLTERTREILEAVLDTRRPLDDLAPEPTD